MSYFLPVCVCVSMHIRRPIHITKGKMALINDLCVIDGVCYALDWVPVLETENWWRHRVSSTPWGSAPGTVHQLQDDTGNLDGSSLLPAYSRTPSIYQLHQANGFLVPFWSLKTAQEISSKKQFPGPASPGADRILWGQRWMTCCSSCLPMTWKWERMEVSMWRLSESICSSIWNKLGEWLYLVFLMAFISLLV